MKNVCVYSNSCFSARSFYVRGQGLQRKRSCFASIGDFLFKFPCLYRIFNVEYSRQSFIKMLDCRGNEKSPNWLFNGNKNLSFLIIQMFY